MSRYLDRPPVVYFVRYQNRIKIGFTKSLEDRLKTFRSTLLGEMELIGTINGGKTRERSLHVHFRPYHLEGEWFRDTPEVRAAIADLIKHDPPRAKPAPIPYEEPDDPAIAEGNAEAEHEEFCRTLEAFTETVFAEPKLIAAWVDLQKPFQNPLTDDQKQNCRDEWQAVHDMASVALLTFYRRDFDQVGALATVRARASRALARIKAIILGGLSHQDAA